MKSLECLIFSRGLQKIRCALDSFLDKSLFDLDAIAAASDNVGLLIGHHDLADVGRLPARRELRLIFPEIEHPTARVAGGPSPDIRDLANDLLSVHVLEVHDVLADQIRSERMKNRCAVERIDKQIVVSVEPL